MVRLLVALGLFVLTPAASARTRADEPALQPGDVVFQTSRSRQSEAISLATQSPWTHVGVVDLGPGGKPVVIEAIGRVSATDWRTFRGRGRGDVLVLRPRGLDARARARVVAEARRFLGRPYDARFGWGDERLYCSELVAKAFARGAKVQLGRKQRLGDLRITSLEAAIRERWGGSVPRDLRLVTPASIAADQDLERVYEGR